jgi:preprotein translocase subunit SecG
MTIATLVFLLTWLDPDRTFTGLAQRTIVVMQVLWLTAAIWMQYLHQRKSLRGVPN